MLENGEIDLIITMGYTKERHEKYDLSEEYMVSDWVQTYVRSGTEIHSAYDLDGKNISGSKNGISIAWFDEYATRYEINYEYIETRSTTEALQYLEDGIAYASVVPKTLGTAHENEFDIVGAPIESYPIRFYAAASKGNNTDLIQAIDKNLAEMKRDDNSNYNAIATKWLEGKKTEVIPYKVKVITASIFILFITILVSTYYLSEKVKRKTEMIKSASEKYSVIINKGNDGIVIEQNDKLKFVNPRFAKMVGYDANDIIGQPFSEYVQNHHKNELTNINRKLWKSEGPADHRYEISLISNENDIIPVEISSTILNYEGKSSIVSVIRDITEHKQHEQELLDAKVKAENANTAQSEFIHNISHELRTPLNSTIGFSEMMITEVLGPLNDKQKKYLNNVKISGKHLLSLINEILNISKIENGEVELELDEVDIYTTVEDVEMLMAPILAENKNELIVNIEANVGKFTADRLKLKQILYNILSNAIKFSPENENIIMDIKVIDGKLQTNITDKGKGLSEKEQANIFQPFVQLDDEHSEKQKGTGLGLTIVKRFVQLHKGKIWIDSEEGKGTTFCFTIPLNIQPDHK
ncbi:ATP-binding protein [Methanococcoides burtonii]|uniref:histidine kinase n=1 Tax=Methanococcoides burtonii (strain DSM 6242 / NBRC 107633 / OCM 468 / ACE-M) TaxID=259564 RepID=Q12U84_METBU|nr:HATPase domain-containing multisensor signal transduction histidine kinase [Methanococcoides burtonii DSM 6242]